MKLPSQTDLIVIQNNDSHNMGWDLSRYNEIKKHTSDDQLKQKHISAQYRVRHCITMAKDSCDP